MKVGDIVSVHDGSYSMFYAGVGSLEHLSGNALRGRQWRVLAANLKAPTGSSSSSTQPPPNDLMLCEQDYPEHILFTWTRACTPIGRAATDAGAKRESVAVTVPASAKELLVRFN